MGVNNSKAPEDFTLACEGPRPNTHGVFPIKYSRKILAEQWEPPLCFQLGREGNGQDSKLHRMEELILAEAESQLEVRVAPDANWLLCKGSWHCGAN